jgi:hypothetical protein
MSVIWHTAQPVVDKKSEKGAVVGSIVCLLIDVAVGGELKAGVLLRTDG